MLSFDHLMDAVIGDGNYQLLLLSIVTSLSISSAFMMTGSVFLAALPESRCRIEPYDNVTLYPNLTAEQIGKVFSPWNTITAEPDRCQMQIYGLTEENNINSSQALEDYINQTAIDVAPCTDGYVYDYSIFESTIVTEWDLVCDRSILSAVSTSMYYVGIFVGSIFGGILSDKFGRIFIFRTACFCCIICGSAVAYSPNFYVFIILRFVLAMTYFQGIAAGYTYVAEISKTKWRIMIGLVFNAVFGIGCMILSGFAYAWRDWRTLQLAVSLVLLIPTFLLSWLVPKSPRWLYGQNRTEEAKEVLKAMAKRNKSPFPTELWMEVEKSNPEKKTDLSSKEKRDDSEKKGGQSLADFFRMPYTRYMICSNMFVWMITSMVYFALVLTGGALPGNIFVNNAVGGLMEFLACMIAVPCIMCMGFTKTTSASLFFASASCLISTILVQVGNDNNAVRIFATILSMCGRFGVSLTFGTIYLHTVELFPTVGRSTAFGLSSMAARVGSIFSPFTVQMQYDIPWLSPVIYGLTASVAALFAATFPDTRKTEFTTTFDEAEDMFSEHLKNSVAAKIFCLPKPKSKNIIDDSETLLQQSSSDQPV